MRRGAGVVERGGLENRCTRERTEGSNPSPSASHQSSLVQRGPEKAPESRGQFHVRCLGACLSSRFGGFRGQGAAG